MSNLSPLIWFFKTFSKWILFFLFTVWIFILGILVGRETTPIKIETNDLQKELAELKKADLEKEATRIKEESKQVMESEELGFFQELKGGPEPLKEFLPTPAPLTVEAKKPVTSKSGTEEQKKRVEAAPVLPPAPPQPRATPEISRDTAKMSIQIASFKDPKAAEARAEELKLRGYDAYVSPGEVANKGTWYRVRIGFFNKQEDAKPTLERLKREKITGFMANIHSE